MAGGPVRNSKKHIERKLSPQLMGQLSIIARHGRKLTYLVLFHISCAFGNLFIFKIPQHKLERSLTREKIEIQTTIYR